MSFIEEKMEVSLPPFRTDVLDQHATEGLTNHLLHRFRLKQPQQDIVVVCIGTDRSTGDALGPLVGSKLKRLNPALPVFGTLEHPVHAVNLAERLDEMKGLHANPYVVAIDACLGQFSNVGSIQVADGPLKPGAGVKKDLPPVGSFHITGVVNVGGFMEYFVLQNTRLYVVMQMAEIISISLDRAIAGLKEWNVSAAGKKS